ncbi:MAG: hypothetical protein M5R40_12500 [Anaerolineae bacterium]|nr:hypothetical protein [Anaerolineae bacterium]
MDDRLGVGHRRFPIPPWIVPAALVLFMVTIFPFFYTLNISLRYVVSRNLRGDWPWIGLENYRQVLGDSVTWETTARTVEFVAIVVTVEMVLGFLLALFLVTEFPGARATRTLLLAPMMVTPIVVGLMWKALFSWTAAWSITCWAWLGLRRCPG